MREQLGRDPVTRFSVLIRCGDGHPLVIRNHPVDLEGNPFPTLYWLTCPEAVRAVSRLEADGWIKRLDERAATEPAFGELLARAHEEYARERQRLATGQLIGGVGGTRVGIKCLHAHYANHLAGGRDPIGDWVAERVQPVHAGEPATGRVASVDMGTNSVRLLVLAPRPEGAPVELARDMVITRLGQGVDETGRLDAGAVTRTIDVLERYARRARALGVERMRVGATSAVRDVGERGTLERMVAGACGVPPEVLSGEREAALSFLGATRSMTAEPPFLVFDIGGGSTELALGSDRVEGSVSVDVGSVRITERVRPADPPTEEDLRRMRAVAAEALGDAASSFATGAARTAIGVAGTVTTVQAISLGLDRYDPDRIHGTTLARRDAEQVATRLAAMTTAQRRALPVMAPGREDVIVAGTLVLLEILERWGFDGCLVSESDILDGLALEMLDEPDNLPRA